MLKFSPEDSAERLCWIEAPLYPQLAPLGLDGILSCFRDACQSEEFATRCANLGFAEVIFHSNFWNQDKGPGYQKFARCLEEQQQSSDARLGLVFHGTPTENIASILKDGLDKEKRHRQQYGPGEYFCKVPGIPERYCRGGLEMLIFLVILPTGCSKEGTPKEYVVVENNDHHIALGTLQFRPAKRVQSSKSQRRHRRCAGFHKQIMDKSSEPEPQQEWCCKGTLVQELMLGHGEIASELYKRWNNILSGPSKAEIAWYVHHQMEDLLRIHLAFPGLPKPMETEDALARRQQSLRDSGNPKPDNPEEFMHPPRTTRPISFPASVVPRFVPPAIPTYITAAGQRAFRVPPLEVKPSSSSNFRPRDPSGNDQSGGFHLTKRARFHSSCERL